MALHTSYSIPAFLVILHLTLLTSNADSINTTLLNPIAPRGGVMAIPLRAPSKTAWPQLIDITLSNGELVSGHVVWMEPTPRSRITWTSKPAPLSVRLIRSDDDASESPGQALLLAPLPQDGDGPIMLLGQTLQPVWRDVPKISALYPVPAGLNSKGRPPLLRHAGAGRPLPEDPLSQWRWWLLAARLERSPPPFLNKAHIDQLTATHYINLWSIGLGRLAEVNPGVARTCCDLLTQTGTFKDRVIALWVADPNITWSLLSDLLNFQLSDHDMTRRALQWCDHQNLVLLFANNIAGPEVELTAINGYARQLVARFHWLGEGIPLAIELKGLQETNAKLSRPTPNDQINLLPQRITQIDPLSLPNTLQAEVHGQVEQLDLGPGRFQIKPPGLTFGPLSPPHTLAALQRSASLAPSPEELTLVELRRVSQQWELMFVCRTPPQPSSTDNMKPTSASPINTLEDIRQREAVAIFIGKANPRIIVIEANGSITHLNSEELPPAVTAHTKRETDRWLARITIPDEWLHDNATDQPSMALLGFVRAHAYSKNIETAPLPSLPWNIEPGRVEVDLTTWTDFPSENEDH